MESIDRRIKSLPEDLQREVEDFVDFLLEKRKRKEKAKPEFLWEGALEELGKSITSVELQHSISKWRIGEKE